MVKKREDFWAEKKKALQNAVVKPCSWITAQAPRSCKKLLCSFRRWILYSSYFVAKDSTTKNTLDLGHNSNSEALLFDERPCKSVILRHFWKKFLCRQTVYRIYYLSCCFAVSWESLFLPLTSGSFHFLCCAGGPGPRSGGKREWSSFGSAR